MKVFIARSSNGRTTAFGAVYLGSNPSLAAIENNQMNTIDINKNFIKLIKRINLLHKEDRNIEAVIFLSIIVESLMLDLRCDYENMINEVLKNNGIEFSIGKYRDLKKVKKYEGSWLIKDYISFFISDKTIMSDIEELILYRNTCAHKLLTNDIDSLNDNLKKQFVKYMSVIKKLINIKKEFLNKKEKNFQMKMLAFDMFKKTGKPVSVMMVNGKPKITTKCK